MSHHRLSRYLRVLFAPTLPLLLASLGATPLHLKAAEPLVAEAPIIVPDSKGGFDFLEVDAAQRRLLANHTGNNTLDVFDLDSGKLLKHVPTGAAQGVAIDSAAGKYYVSVSREKLLVIVDDKTLEKVGQINLAGPADALAFNPKNHRAYVGHDDGKELWVIDPQAGKVVATVTIPEGPEYVIHDAASDRLFQNIKSNDSIVVIDSASNTITEQWTTAPAKAPHGLAHDPATHRLFAAGNNGKLAVLDTASGEVVASVEIAPGVDQIAIDLIAKRLYCASRTGVISVLEETPEGGVVSLGDVKSAAGAKTIAVDPKTHAVWVAYADKEHSYLRRLAPPSPPH